MNNKKYKLVGVLNYFKEIPRAVYLIFADENKKLYSAVVDNDKYEYCISKFIPLPDEYIKDVKDLNKCVVKMESVQDYYSIGDIAVCGIEIEENGMYLGRIDKYLEFLNYYKNEFVEISECDFKDELIKKLNCEIEFMEVLVNQAREDGMLPKTNNKV